MTLDDLAHRAGADVREVARARSIVEWSTVQQSARRSRAFAAGLVAAVLGSAAIAAVWLLGSDPPPATLAPTPPATASVTQAPTEPAVAPTVTSGDVVATSSIDADAQQLAEDTLALWLDGTDLQGAIVLMDTATSTVLAAAGNSADEFLPGVGRPAASLAAPFLALAALEQGYEIDSIVEAISPMTLEVDGTEITCWNAGAGNVDERSLRDALVLSVNTPFCRLVADIGSEVAGEVVGRVFPTAVEAGPSLATGDFPATPLEVASAYAALAGGEWRTVGPVDDIAGVMAPTVAGTRPFPADNTEAVGAALEEAVTRGTGTRAQLDRPVSGKTGTAADFTDAWFAGSTDGYTAVVWIGRGGVPLEDVTVRDQRYVRVFGGTLPAPIWQDFMAQWFASD